MPSFGDSTLHGLGTRSLQYMIPQIVDNILKKTNQSQAMTPETTAQPFRFLDLPTELQQMVLDRYFREPWIITASRSDVRDDSDLDNVASSTVRYRPSSSLFISSFLTHRKFYTQGQIAIAKTKGNTYIDRVDEIDGPMDIALPLYMRQAISIVWDQRREHHRDAIMRYSEQFPCLENLHLGSYEPEMLDRTRRLVENSKLEDICKGEIKDKLEEACKDDFKALFGSAFLDGQVKEKAPHLNRIEFVTGWVQLCDTWSVEVPEWCVVAEHELKLNVSFSEDRCNVQLRFEPVAYWLDHPLGYEATLENLQKLVLFEANPDEDTD
ncbi:hypothetical protein PMZ80_006154 [Knufia obscura]|uniref:Uncharacterized protein n=1 Tax=Knufia obscura TaxID=1635080 RepID=A0ABR0RPN6_9EURO|nr:hypothetical protein PMZ80_006154 [Knufia obscura]